jgi:hypothetical protein
MVRRGALALIMFLAALGAVPAQSTAAAADWRAEGWYGTVTLDQSAVSDAETVRRHLVLRVDGATYSVVEASGSATFVSGSGCVTHSAYTFVGPGTPLAFGSQFAVEPGEGGADDYRISAFQAPMLTQMNVSSSPPGCSGQDGQRTETTYYDVTVGCGAIVPTAERLAPRPCSALDRTHLRGAVDYTNPFTETTERVIASWDLSTDPSNLSGPFDPRVSVSATGAHGSMGSACGAATFGWRHVTRSKTSVRSGEHACVFLVGNRLTRQLLDVTSKHGVTIGKAFAGTVLRSLVQDYKGEAAKGAAGWMAKRVLLKRMAAAVGANADRFAPITMVGKFAGLLGVPLAGLWTVNQIKNNDACLQVIVDRDGSDLKVDWSMVYAHSSDPGLTRAKVYKKVAKRFSPDGVEAVKLGLTCTKSGTVRVSSGQSGAMSGKVTSFLDLR